MSDFPTCLSRRRCMLRPMDWFSISKTFRRQNQLTGLNETLLRLTKQLLFGDSPACHHEPLTLTLTLTLCPHPSHSPDLLDGSLSSVGSSTDSPGKMDGVSPSSSSNSPFASLQDLSPKWPPRQAGCGAGKLQTATEDTLKGGCWGSGWNGGWAELEDCRQTDPGHPLLPAWLW